MKENESIKWHRIRPEFVEGWPMMGLYLAIVVTAIAANASGAFL